MIDDVIRGMRKSWWRGLLFVVVIPVGWCALAFWRGLAHPLAALLLAPLGLLVWAWNGWLEQTRR